MLDEQGAALALQLTRTPHDRQLRLVFADWLEENGQTEEAATQRLLTQRLTYYWNGKFANVYDIFAVPYSQAGRFEALFPSAERITRKQALWWAVTRPNQARDAGEQWFGGFAEYDGVRHSVYGMPDIYSRETADRILLGADATLGAMSHKEMLNEASEDYWANY